MKNLRMETPTEIRLGISVVNGMMRTVDVAVWGSGSRQVLVDVASFPCSSESPGIAHSQA